MILDDETLFRITGYRSYGWQRKWLIQHGWTFEVSAQGHPVVSRAYAESRLGNLAPTQKTWSPNLEVLKKVA